MPDVSSARAERLVNLVLCLLSTRQFLPAEKIRATVPGYADAATDEAFFRMFERDKTELRELGVPLETGRNSGFDTADGYRIARHDYELGEIDLEPDEAAAVALAARLWDTPELAGAAHGAVLKLRAAGVEVDETGGPVQARVRAVEPAFGPLLAAVQAGQVVTFPHRRGGPTGEVSRRTVEPWGVVSARGRWYLVGHDRDRADVRSFRLSRIAGPVTTLGPPEAVQVPPGVDLLAVVDRGVGATAGDRDGPAVGRGRSGERPAPAGPAGAARGRRRRAGDRPAQPGHRRPVGRRLRTGRGGAAPRRSSRRRCGGPGRGSPRRMATPTPPIPAPGHRPTG